MNADKTDKLSPFQAVNDAKLLAESKGYTISPDAEKLIKLAEEVAHEHNVALMGPEYLYSLLKIDKEFRSYILRKGCDPDVGAQACLDFIGGSACQEEYSTYQPPYTFDLEYPSIRASQIVASLVASRARGSRELSRDDYILGLFSSHEDVFPALMNGEWIDERLHTPFITLSHIICEYNQNLWIKFTDIKVGLSLLSGSESRNSVVESTPAHVRSALLSLMSDYEDYYKNCFLIMPFQESTLHREVRSALKLALSKIGINLLRADDRTYSENLFTNIEAYMCGCSFGIAIHERVYDDTHNANVTLEVGYMLGKGKSVCLLKERSVKALPSDLQGRLYCEFEAESTADSVTAAIFSWLADKRIGLPKSNINLC